MQLINKKKSVLHYKKTIITLVVVFLLAIFSWAGWLSFANQAIVWLTRPVVGWLYQTSPSGSYNNQTSRAVLLGLLKNKDDQLTKLAVDEAKLNSLQTENESLRQYLKFNQSQSAHLVLANVIYRDFLSATSWQNNELVIDQGKNASLVTGQAVVSQAGAIIGCVGQVRDASAQVYLITNQNCRLAAAINNETQTSGIAQGDLGLTVKLNFIPQTEKLSVGQLVVSSGLTASVPAGLPIGRIVQINQENNGLWQDAIVEPLDNLDRLLVVGVLIK